MTTEDEFLQDVAKFLQFEGLLDFTQPVDIELDESNAYIPSSFGADTTNSNCGRKCRGQKDLDKERQRRHRQRFRDARKTLLQQVDELSSQLLRLKKASSAKEKELLSAMLTNPWGIEATRQRERRLRSKAQQRRQVDAINTQNKYIDHFRDIVGPRKQNYLVSGNSYAADRPRFSPITGVLYITYLQELEGCYARADSVFDSCGLISLPQIAVTSVHRRGTGGGVAYFQHVNKVALPYTFQDTSRALENLLFPDHQRVLDEDVSEADAFIQTRVLQPVAGGALSQRFIPRQYKAANRTLFVWKVSSDSEGIFSGLHSCETAWLRVQSTHDGVLLEICVQQVPMCTTSSLHDDAPAIGQFYKTLQDALGADKQQMTSVLDDLLHVQ